MQNENDLRKKALMDQMGEVPPMGGGGLDVGGPAVPIAEGPTQAPPFVDVPPGPAGSPVSAATDYTKRGKFATFNAGADDKYNRPWDQLSERYKMQTVLSNFDPNAGITPDVLAALNGANIKGAKFSGSGDKLDAQNLQQWENFDGRQGVGDMLKGFNDPAMAGKHEWGAWQPEDSGGGQPQGAPSGGLPNFGGAQLDSALGGDPLAKIQELIAQLSAGGNRPNFEALMAQLGGQ